MKQQIFLHEQKSMLAGDDRGEFAIYNQNGVQLVTENYNLMVYSCSEKKVCLIYI